MSAADMQPSVPFQTTESVLVDGANAIGLEPARHFPHAASFCVVACIAVVAAAILMRRRTAAVLVVLALGALPGLYGLLWSRADAPLARNAVAAVVASTLDEIRHNARWPSRPPVVVSDDDGVLFPLGRYAMPSRADGATLGAIGVRLRGMRLGQPCVRDPATRDVVCGAPP